MSPGQYFDKIVAHRLICLPATTVREEFGYKGARSAPLLKVQKKPDVSYIPPYRFALKNSRMPCYNKLSKLTSHCRPLALELIFQVSNIASNCRVWWVVVSGFLLTESMYSGGLCWTYLKKSSLWIFSRHSRTKFVFKEKLLLSPWNDLTTKDRTQWRRESFGSRRRSTQPYEAES